MEFSEFDIDLQIRKSLRPCYP